MQLRRTPAALLLTLACSTLVGCTGVDRPSSSARANPREDQKRVVSAVRRSSPRAATPVTHKEDGSEVTSASESIVQLAFQPPEAQHVLTPEEAVALALAVNPDLETARQHVAYSAAVLAQARAGWYPRVQASQRYAVTDNPNQVFAFLQNQGRLSLGGGGLSQAASLLNDPPTTDNFLTQLTLKHSLYTGGRREAQTRAAESRHNAGQFASRAVQNELVFHVIEAYYRTLQARELVDVRHEAVEQVEKHLEDARSRHQVGTAVKSDVFAFQVRFAEVEEDLISAQNRSKLAWAILENVIGAPLNEWTLPGEIPEARWTAGFDRIETAVAEALERRPEVFQLEKQSQSAEQEVRVAEAGKHPQVDFMSSYDLYSGDLNQGRDSFFVGLAVGLNLFDAGRTKGAERQAQATVCRLRAQSERLLLDIELNVRRAFLQLDDAKQRYVVTGRGLAYAEENLREVLARYRGEMATITEMMDAQVAQSNARVRNVETRADVEVARTALAHAVGQLVDAFSP